MCDPKVSHQGNLKSSLADAWLSMAGIVSLTFLAFVRPDWDSKYVIGAIVALAMRATGLVTHAARLRRVIAADKDSSP